MTTSQRQRAETATRFGFGKNWRAFLDRFEERRALEAVDSLRDLLQVEDLAGRSFLDIGCGSGLFSLAARRLGARVHSFDFDRDSVDCTSSLREENRPGDPDWTVERGSILDPAYLEGLGHFDVVYSWGVLHHTGAMFESIRNAAERVAPGGLLAIALYRKTRLCWLWKLEKRTYTRLPGAAQSLVRALWIQRIRLTFFLKGKSFARMVADYPERRGMDFHSDVHDWLGGYPYESIEPDAARDCVQVLGFELTNERVLDRKSWGFSGSGCDEFVFRRRAD